MSKNKSQQVDFQHCVLRLTTTRRRTGFFLDVKQGRSLDEVPMKDRELIAAAVAAHVCRPHEEIYETVWAAVGKAWEGVAT